jgi:predicted metal-dependent hydrolase
MDYPSRIKVGLRFYDVVYEDVLKLTSSVRIKKGRVEVRLSKFLRGRKREETVSKFLKWSEKKLNKASCELILNPEYKDGGTVFTHNCVYEISVVHKNKKTNSVKISEGGVIEVYLGLNRASIRDLVERAIIKDQTPYLSEVLDELNRLYFDEKINSVRFKRMSSRFGSCSSKRNINISFRLLFAPREVFRYVCVHELAHLKEMNHSKNFWKLVCEAMPNYKESEKWLKNSGLLLG